jgi:hypothetical protein
MVQVPRRVQVELPQHLLALLNLLEAMARRVEVVVGVEAQAAPQAQATQVL